MSRIHTPSSLVLVGLLLAACGDNSTAQPSVVSDSATPTTQPIQPSDASTTELSADETQTVRLTDFAIEMPEVVAGPFIDIELVNDGTLAHEVAFARIEPGTTAEQVLDALAGGGESSAFLLGDPGGINLIGPGGRLRYQRQLDPGSYVVFCPFPFADGTSHHHAGMIHLFTVSASTTDRAAAADATMTLQDDGITVSGLQPGTRSYAITNAGTTPHEVYIMGFPAGTDLTRTDEVGSWIENGQVGPAPLDVHLPGGHQTIEPGTTVIITMTMRAAHTYLLEDYSGLSVITTEISLP